MNRRLCGVVVSAMAALLLASAARAGTLLVANKAEGSVTLLRSPGFERITTLPTGLGPHEIALSPEGLRALVTNYGTRDEPGHSLTLLDLAKLRPVATIELPAGSKPHGIAWANATTALVSAEGLRALLIVDVPSGEVRARIPVDQDGSHMLAASRDGKHAWLANMGSGSVSAVDVVRQRTVAEATAGAGTEGIALVREGSELWVSNREADTVSVFAARSLEKLADIPVSGFPIRVEADDARGRVYVTLARADGMAVIDTEQREVTQVMDFDIESERSEPTMLANEQIKGSIPVGVLLTGGGEFLIVAHTNAHVMSVWDADKLKLLKVFSAGQEPDGMAWTWIDLPLR